jgi:hypothetical protein
MEKWSYRGSARGRRRRWRCGVNCYPATVIYSPSGSLRLISAVHAEVETVELIRPSTCQHEGTAASTTRGNPGNRAGYFSPARGTCGQTLSTAETCGRRAHHTSSPGRIRSFSAEDDATTRRNISSAMTCLFEKVKSFQPKGQGLVNGLSSLTGMCP